MMKKSSKFKKWLSGLTIGKKLLAFDVLVVLLPTAVMLCMFYGQFYSIVQGSILDSQAVTSLQASKNINNIADKLLSVSTAIGGDQSLRELLTATEEDAAQIEQPETAGFLSNATFSAVVNSHVDNTSVSAVRIYTDAPIAQQGRSALFEPLERIRNTYWFGIFVSTPTQTIFAPDFYLSGSEREELGSLAVIQRCALQGPNGVVTAFVAVYTQMDVLVDPISDIEPKSVEGVISYIINSRDTVVAQTGETAYGTYAMVYDEIPANISGEGLFVAREVAGTRVFMTYRDIPGTDWRMAWIIPADSILSQSKTIILKFVSIYLVIALLVFTIGIVLSNSIAGRLRSLQEQMQKVKSERPSPLTLDPGTDEIGDLIETYNYMVGLVNTLLDDTIEAAEELNNVKITALRTQIDPHFLYNTLDMINWLTKNGRNDRASEAILALSRFYRLTLNRGNLTATVAAELEHVSLYVKLMNMRFDNTIDFVVDVPEELLDYEIPLIIFQPIVENAIQHGIFEKPTHHGAIIITGWEEDEMLYFLISDDGIGMTAEQISSLLKNRPNTGANGGIGVYNTHRRLQLMYHNVDCGLSYTSEYGKGTDVTFRIPKRLRREENAHETQEA